ncbi:MAG: phenylpropionate dioxygenase-like ring-hydroxylating dioxygenase large terminal subunit [Parasphingorhabdus sp.]|jgi:phenylpropionate dioxygenase-like ring-hydroxylating dioxygenase large terminal subunit
MEWFSGTVADEDVGLCERVQRGLRSRGYQQGRFVVDRGRVECSEHHVHWYQAMVGNSF